MERIPNHGEQDLQEETKYRLVHDETLCWHGARESMARMQLHDLTEEYCPYIPKAGEPGSFGSTVVGTRRC